MNSSLQNLQTLTTQRACSVLPEPLSQVLPGTHRRGALRELAFQGPRGQRPDDLVQGPLSEPSERCTLGAGRVPPLTGQQGLAHSKYFIAAGGTAQVSTKGHLGHGLCNGQTDLVSGSRPKAFPLQTRTQHPEPISAIGH